MSLTHRLDDAPLGFGPVLDADVVAIFAHAASSEEVAVFDDSYHVIQDIGSIIHEVSYSQLPAVDRLLRPPSAESNLELVDVNFFEEPVKSEPLLCPLLNSGSTLGYDPHPALKQAG